MMDKNLFKSRKFIILLSMMITVALIASTKFILQNNALPAEYSILPVLSLMLGPYAVLGFAIVEIGYWVIFLNQTDIFIILFNTLCITLLGIIPWKFWYTVMHRKGITTPNMDSLYNFIKIASILVIIALQSYLLINNKICIIPTPSNEFYGSTVITTFILIMLIIGVFERYEIPVYTPQIQFKKLMPNESYIILFAASIIIEIIMIILSDLNDAVLICICLALTIIFLVKPYDSETFSIKRTLNHNVFYKVSLSIFLMTVVLSAIITITYMGVDQLYIGHRFFEDVEMFIYFYLSIFSSFILVFLIPLIIYMLFLERQVINPINQLSNYLSKEINSYEDVDELKDNLKSIIVNNEIKSLSESLLGMEHELVDYSEDLIRLTKEKERYETELKLAHDIQYSMIPTDFKEFYENRNFELWGSMNAAREVGGDFYDYFQIDEDNVGFVIGDVSGKGVTAALIMVKAMTLIEDYAKQYDDLSKVFYEVNNELCNGNSEMLFITCWMGKINTKTHELSFVNAGHNPPLLKQDDEFEYLETSPDLVLAAMEDMPYETHKMQLKSNDMIFLYTDGVTEANDNYNGFYGDERLKNMLNKHRNDDLNVTIKSIEDDIATFCNNQDKFDDTTMFLLKLN